MAAGASRTTEATSAASPWVSCSLPLVYPSCNVLCSLYTALHSTLSTLLSVTPFGVPTLSLLPYPLPRWYSPWCSIPHTRTMYCALCTVDAFFVSLVQLGTTTASSPRAAASCPRTLLPSRCVEPATAWHSLPLPAAAWSCPALPGTAWGMLWFATALPVTAWQVLRFLTEKPVTACYCLAGVRFVTALPVAACHCLAGLLRLGPAHQRSPLLRDHFPHPPHQAQRCVGLQFCTAPSPLCSRMLRVGQPWEPTRH